MTRSDPQLAEPIPADANVAHLTWDIVDARIKAGAIAILPVGAASKQHGLHLPLDTDQIQAEYLAGHLADHIDALIWPTITYGYYPAFTDYPGSISLSARTFTAMVTEIAAGIVSSGVDRLIVLDTGISTIAPLSEALARWPNALHLPVHRGARYVEVANQLTEQEYGSHADEIETSLMLAIAPQRVAMARASASPPGRGNAPGALSRTDPSSPNYSPSGSFGDPTKSTHAKGQILLAAMLDDVVTATLAFVGASGRESAAS